MTGHIVAQTIRGGVTHSLTSEGGDASEDGTGRGTPIVAIEQRGGALGFHMTQDPISPDEQVPCIGAKSVGNGVMVTPLALRGRDGGAELEAAEPGSPANALRSAGGGGGGSLYPLVSISQDDTPRGVAENQQGELREGNTVGALLVGGGKPGQGYPAIREGTIVRRLTPLECERLQGYPDGWTDNGQADSARYRQLGNSVAVPCVQWIAERLIAIDGEVRA